jgi:hypothetical protein
MKESSNCYRRQNPCTDTSLTTCTPAATISSSLSHCRYDQDTFDVLLCGLSLFLPFQSDRTQQSTLSVKRLLLSGARAHRCIRDGFRWQHAIKLHNPPTRDANRLDSAHSACREETCSQYTPSTHSDRTVSHAEFPSLVLDRYWTICIDCSPTCRSNGSRNKTTTYLRW